MEIIIKIQDERHARILLEMINDSVKQNGLIVAREAVSLTNSVYDGFEKAKIPFVKTTPNNPGIKK